MKKQLKTKEKPISKKLTEKPVSKNEELASEPTNTFDFGGLPQRDLKKNLGCG
jgi:hypothetical protein